MQDERFKHAIILICDHDENQALGLIINRKINGMDIKNLFSQLDLDDSFVQADFPIFDGGPCQPERGFVIHSSDYKSEDSISIKDGIFLSVSKDILDAISKGLGPKNMLIALGYAGWGKGQLEAEINEDSWIISDIDIEGLCDFDELDDKWYKTYLKLGIDLSRLSMTSGHA